MKIVQLIIAVLFYTSSFGQTNLSPISKLKSYTTAPDPDTLYKYKNILPYNLRVVSKNYNIYIDTILPTGDTFPPGIKLKLKDTFRFYKRLSVLAVNDGYLIGVNGKVANYLFWASKTDTIRYDIEQGGAISFIQRKGKIYAIQRSVHGCDDDGKILEIKNKNGKWHSIPYLNLNSGPYVISPYKKHGFIMLSTSGMYLIDRKKRIQTLMDGDLWEYFLYPNSLVIKNKIIYAGVGIGIIKYNLATNKEEWLLTF